MKYSSVVVLAAGVTVQENGPREFDDGENKVNYVIEGDEFEFRFKAVKKLFETGACKNFILVGGQVKTVAGGKKGKFFGVDGKTIAKPTVMKHCLVKYYGMPADALTVVESESNTQGNVKAVSDYFVSYQEHSLPIGLLSNYYHLLRALRMFAHGSALHLSPIPAESVVYYDEFENIKQFYKTTGFSYMLGSEQFADSQIKGLADIENGTYAPRFK